MWWSLVGPTLQHSWVFWNMELFVVNYSCLVCFRTLEAITCSQLQPWTHQPHLTGTQECVDWNEQGGQGQTTVTEVWQGNWHCPSDWESMTELLFIFSILFLIKRRVNKMPQVIKRLDSLFELSLEQPSPERVNELSGQRKWGEFIDPQIMD